MGRGRGPLLDDDDEDVALRRSGLACVFTREGSMMNNGRWVKVAADLENLTLRLDNRALAGSTRSRSSEVYAKEMQIHRGTKVERAPQPSRPFVLAVSNFKGGKDRRRLLDFLTREAGDAWFDLLYKMTTTDLETLLEPLMEARHKRRDAVQHEEALAARPARVDEALEALRRGRLPADFVARDASGRAVTALLTAARAGRADVVEALVALGARPDGPPLPAVQDRRPTTPDRRLERQRSVGSSSESEIPPPPASDDTVPTVEETPLLGATRADRHDAAAALLRAGADPTLGDARGAKETPLLCCARRGSAEIARALLRALAGRAAAATDDAKRLKLLCHVDRRFGLHPETALEAAAVAGHAAVVVALCAGAECRGENDQVHVCRADATLRNPSGRTAMHLACDRGRATVVAPLAAAGADVDARDPDGTFPLELAAQHGHVACVAALLQRDATAPLDPQLLQGSDAARAGRLVLATDELRVAVGADAFDARGAADLAKIVRAEIKAGELPRTAGAALANFPADVCATSSTFKGNSALLRCCDAGDGAGADLWLTLGADVNHADHGVERRTPLMACAARGDIQLASALLATGRCSVDAIDVKGCTALVRAAEASAACRADPVRQAATRRVADLLLEHGADPLAVDAIGRSPLSLAAADARDHRLVARMLAFPKVPADFAHGDDEATVLMLAAALPEASSVLRTLLGAPDLAADSGLKNMRGRRRSAATCARADLRRRDARGRTALFYAAEADRAENVELLLSLGRRASSTATAAGDLLDQMLDVDERDAAGQTALRVATAAGARGAVGALLRFGASASDAERAQLEEDEEVIKSPGPPLLTILETAAPIARTLGRFRAAVANGDDNLVLRYVARGNYDVDEPTSAEDGARTALIVACTLGNAAGAARLLDVGADANGRDASRETALLAAARSGALIDASAKRRGDAQDRSLAELLLDAGADATAADGLRRETALHVVCGSMESILFIGGARRRRDAAALLLERGADPEAVDAAGRTPLLLASGEWPPADTADYLGMASPDSTPTTPQKKKGPTKTLSELVASSHSKLASKDLVSDGKPADHSTCEAPHADAVLEALLVRAASVDLDRRHNLKANRKTGAPARVATALGEACVAGRIVAVKALLRAGAGPDAPADGRDRTALALAARFGRAQVTRRLCEAGAELARAPYADGGRTALHHAAARAHPAAVAVLLRAGAPSFARDLRGRTPLDGCGVTTESDVEVIVAGPEAPERAAPDPMRIRSIGSGGGDDLGRPFGDRAAACANQLLALRFAVNCGDFRKVSDLVASGAFSLEHGAGPRALEKAAKLGDAEGVDVICDAYPGGAPPPAVAAAALDAAAAGRRAYAAAALFRRSCRPAADGKAAAALAALAVDVGNDELLRLALDAGADAACATTGLPTADEKPNSSFLSELSVAQKKIRGDESEDEVAPPTAKEQRDYYATALWAARSAGATTSDLIGDPRANPPKLSALSRAAAAPRPRGPRALGVLLDGTPRAAQALRRAVHNAAQGSDVSPLHAAAAADAVDALATLVRAWRRECATGTAQEAGAFARDGGKRTPLHVACALGAYDAAATLVALHAGDEAARKALLAAEDAKGQRPLHRAARADDGAVASLLLGAGADSEATDDAGRTARDACVIGAASAARRLDAMRRAVRDGDFDKALRLVARGCFPISSSTREGDTVLTRAAAAGRGDVVDAAIALGAGQVPETTTIPENSAAPATSALVSPARPDRVGPEVLQALGAAAKARQLQSAERLLASDPNVRPRENDAAPLLRVAVARRRHALAELLLVRGVEPLAPCAPVARARAGGDVLPRGDCRVADNETVVMEEVDPEPTTPFLVAVESGDLAAVRVFLDQHNAIFDVDQVARDGSTALMTALSHGHVRVAHALVAAGADVTATDARGRTALERACFDHEALKADLRTVAAACDRADYLAQRKAVKAALDEDARDSESEGTEPRQVSDDEAGHALPATPSRQSRIARLAAAFERGNSTTPPPPPSTQPTTPSYDDALSATDRSLLDRALVLAVRLRDADAVDRLLAAGADALAPVSASSPETALWKSCAAPDLATLRALVAHAGDGFDVNVRHGVVRATPLCVLVASGDADACALLLDAGADASIRDARGRGPLWHAAHRGHGNVVRCLATRLETERGGDVVRSVVDARDCDGITPLHAAARVGARAAIATLLQAGADATIKCEQGRTPRQLALLAQHKDAANQLDAMSLAIVDGDYAECIRLARNGNWPLDWTAGADDVEGYDDEDDTIPPMPEADDPPRAPDYNEAPLGYRGDDAEEEEVGEDAVPAAPPDDDEAAPSARSQSPQDSAY